MREASLRSLTAVTPDQLHTKLELVGEGRAFSFSEPLDRAIPRIAAGCYTIWHTDGSLVYAGMAGRGLTAEAISLARAAPRPRPAGLLSRLGSHRSGRRSGDQFCIYVFDFFVLPTLGPADVAEVVGRRRRLDDDVRAFIGQHLSYRWAETADASEAFELERELVGGALGEEPFLNPGRVEGS